MKKQFFDYLIDLMKENKDIYFISVGLGWPRTDEIKEKFPDQYIQTEASEQSALDIAVGLAYAGKKPVVYTITPFYWRAAETLRTYISHEDLPVILIGAGRGEDYGVHDGFSHSATDITKLLDMLTIAQSYPKSVEELRKIMKLSLGYKYPIFISVPR